MKAQQAITRINMYCDELASGVDQLHSALERNWNAHVDFYGQYHTPHEPPDNPGTDDPPSVDDPDPIVKPPFVNRGSQKLSDYDIAVKSTAEAVSDIFDLPTYDVIGYIQQNPYSSKVLTNANVSLPQSITTDPSGDDNAYNGWGRYNTADPLWATKVSDNQFRYGDTSSYDSRWNQYYGVTMRPLYARRAYDPTATSSYNKYSRTIHDEQAWMRNLLNGAYTGMLAQNFRGLDKFNGDWDQLGPDNFTNYNGVLGVEIKGQLDCRLHFRYNGTALAQPLLYGSQGNLNYYGNWGYLPTGSVVFGKAQKSWLKEKILEPTIYYAVGHCNVLHLALFKVTSLKQTYQNAAPEYVGKLLAFSPHYNNYGTYQGKCMSDPLVQHWYIPQIKKA